MENSSIPQEVPTSEHTKTKEKHKVEEANKKNSQPGLEEDPLPHKKENILANNVADQVLDTEKYAKEKHKPAKKGAKKGAKETKAHSNDSKTHTSTDKKVTGTVRTAGTKGGKTSKGPSKNKQVLLQLLFIIVIIIINK